MCEPGTGEEAIKTHTVLLVMDVNGQRASSDESGRDSSLSAAYDFFL